jgi:hypothetical protein
MASVEEAAQAIAHLHNQRLAGSVMPLVVRYADSQEQKQKKAQRQQRQQYERYPAPGSYGHPPMAPAGPYHHQQHQHAEHMGYYSPGAASDLFSSVADCWSSIAAIKCSSRVLQPATAVVWI